MYHKLSNKTSHAPGFTIIEAMMVIAISGLITAIVFIAIPEVQANKRNIERKAYVHSIIGAVIEYTRNNGRIPSCAFPHSDPTQCPGQQQAAINFLTKYLPEGSDPSTGVEYRSNTASPVDTGFCDGVVTTTGTIYCWTDTSAYYTHHSFPLSTGQIVIVASHICGPGNNLSNIWLPGAIQDQPGGDNGIVDMSVVVKLENGEYYCVTNGT
jgi:type II secretory pathway pseudopilin PulG